MSDTNTSETRLSVRLKGPLAAHANHQVDTALYESHSEYIRDLIRRDMSGESYDLRDAIIQGYADIGAGRIRDADGHERIFQTAMQELKDEGFDISSDS